MPIVKRKTPEERVDITLGPNWRAIVAAPLVKAISQPQYHNGIDVSPLALLDTVERFNDARWITNVGLNQKVFAYVCGIVARRAGVEGLIDDDLVSAIGKHLYAMSTQDKIDKFEGIDFAFRQCMLWDVPAFLDQYKKPGSYVLPELRPKVRVKPKPKKLKLKKLKKHKNK